MEAPFVPSFKSFEDILNHYHKFLGGEIDSCPTHDGPLDEESSKILPELLRINKCGVLTVDSQPGLVEIQNDNCQIQQLAYLDCYMHQSKYEHLVKELDGKDIVMFGAEYTKPSNEPPKGNIPVTVSLNCIDDEWQSDVLTAMPLNWLSDDLDIILEETAPKISSRIKKGLYSVRIVETVWGREKHLFETIADCLHK